jgi:CubicO group peptidase (beta-lactamase class C family)
VRPARHRCSARPLAGAAATLALLLALSILGGCTRTSFRPGDSLDEFTAYLDGRIPHLIERYGVAGVSLALVRGGELVWSGAYGYADLAEGRRMSVDAVCRAESISKSVTAWGVMRLVQQGRIGLDDPVQRYLADWRLPETPYDEGEVTVRRLLSGNAGMPLGTIGKAAEYAPQSEMPSLREELSQEARLVREPGSGFVYSNPGFNLLELLVEEVTGRGFSEYMAEEVLAPLGMESSSYAWRPSLRSSLPTGYELQGEPVPPYVYPVKAAGGLFAPVEDIARFVCAGMTGSRQVDRSVLTRESIRALYTPQVEIPGLFGLVADAYGFGHFIETLPSGRRAVWHGGQGHGWMTHFHFVPESGEGIVILTNSQRSWPLIAEVLADWSRWAGVGPVKFSRITYATIGLRVLIVIVLLLSAWLVSRLVWGVRTRGRRWAPLSRDSRAGRALLATAGLAGIAALAWSLTRPYLFVSSIFPSSAGWAGIALLALALVLIVLALFPRFDERNQEG